MLSERQLESILDVFRQRMQRVTDDFLNRMGQHLRAIGTLTATDVNALVEMAHLHHNVEAIKREIAKAAEMSIADVDQVFLKTAESDARFAQQVFATDHTPSIRHDPYLSRILKAQAKVTKQALANLSQTTIATETYRNAVDVAIQTVQAGVKDYNSAIRQAVKKAATDGLRVKYPSGLTRRLDSAVRQNVLDGVRALNNDILYQIGKEYGADGIEISAHALCAEDHLPYQGRQYSNREFNEIQTLRLKRPFGLWNCKHTMHPIILGVSEPTYTDEELEQFRRSSNKIIEIDGRRMTRYQWSQEQRRIETAVRYQKDVAIAAKASGDDVLRRETQANINALQDRYSSISAAAGLGEQRNRMTVAGFNKVKTADQLKNPAKYGIIQSQNNVSINLQIFAEKDIARQSTKSLEQGIATYRDRIVEHKNKIANPARYYPDWDNVPDVVRRGRIAHWEKEIKNFEESIANREDELRRRERNGKD